MAQTKSPAEANEDDAKITSWEQRHERDVQRTAAWRDRVTRLVFCLGAASILVWMVATGALLGIYAELRHMGTLGSLRAAQVSHGGTDGR